LALQDSFGTRLIDICKNEFDITNLDKQQSPFFPDLTTIGDIRNSDSIKNMYGKETVVLLAAEHRDDVSPVSLYYEVNVLGTRNVFCGITRFDQTESFFPEVFLYGIFSFR
jgi:nucleoside-diphosphate-sugar epimerase